MSHLFQRDGSKRPYPWCNKSKLVRGNMITDPIADALTRIRNAQRAGHKSVKIRYSKMNLCLVQVLKNEGFISYFEKKDAEVAGQFDIEVGLKYFSTGELERLFFLEDR